MQIENGAGALVQDASGLLQYRISKDAIGKFVSFKCTPVRDDGIVGEPRTTMAQERVRPGDYTSSENHPYHIQCLIPPFGAFMMSFRTLSVRIVGLLKH